MAKKVKKLPEKEMVSEKPKKKKGFFRWWMVLVAVLVVGGVIGFKVVKAKNGDVNVATIEKGDIQELLILSGEVKAREHANISFQSGGRVTWLGVAEGDQVIKGQALAKLDTVVLNASYQKAQADLRNTDAALAEVYDDLKDKDETESFEEKATRTAAEVARDKAWDSLLAAQQMLRDATLTAPFDGVITKLTNPYNNINILATQSQIEIVNPETIYFEVLADQTELIDMRVGQKVGLVFDAYADDRFEGFVRRIGITPKAGEAGTVYVIEIEIEGDRSRLRVGMTGDVEFVMSEKSEALMVPYRYVNSDDDGRKYVNLERRNHKVYIETGLEGEEMVEIKGEVSEGMSVYD